MPDEFVALQQPFGEDAIRTVNFFNSRLLTGNDMGREQAARREVMDAIGLAIGDGIARVHGVENRCNIALGRRRPTSVRPGVAVNRLGATLCLKQPVTLALDRAATPGESNVACLFGDCAPLADGDYVAGAGLYLLTIAPAFTSEGRAAVSGMGDTTGRCAFDATVEAANTLLRTPANDAAATAAGEGFAQANGHLLRLLAQHLNDEEDMIIPLILDRGEGPLGVG